MCIMTALTKNGILDRRQSFFEGRINILSDRSNAVILHETLLACCIPEVVRMETGEVIYERVNAPPRPPPKISLKHEWMKELGSEVAQRPMVGGESHQSLAHKGLRVFIFFIMLWKDQREPTIKLCMGRQVDVVQDAPQYRT